MIRPLRQRHRRIVICLGVTLPVAFIVGIAARPPEPRVSSLPIELADSPTTLKTKIWERSDLFPKAKVQVRLSREGAAANRLVLELSAIGDFVKPDLIVYWVAGNSGVTDSLPENARLLGAFHSAALFLPASVVNENGVIVQYSLADNEVVDVSKPIRVADSTR